MKTSRRRTTILATAVVALAVAAPAATLHVWTNSPFPAPPYDAWTNAAHTIQEAVDAAGGGDTVLVTNGVYETGGRPSAGTVLGLTNRVVATNGIHLRSVNGPGFTAIAGHGPMGTDAIRCVYMIDGAISGFTLTNGHTVGNVSFGADEDYEGGGAYLRSVTMSNCTITACGARFKGGGVRISGGALQQCILFSNRASGYVYSPYPYPPSYPGAGGGAFASNTVVSGCSLNNNYARQQGGGFYGYPSAISQCSFISNTASSDGGGMYIVAGGFVAACTASYNRASWYGGAIRVGADTMISNSVIRNNYGCYGGGIRGDGLVIDSVLRDNTATSHVSDFTAYGGGGYGGQYVRCLVEGNVADSEGDPFANYGYGGGLCGITLLQDSIVRSNLARRSGGGVLMGSGLVVRCTIEGNRCGYEEGGGIRGSSDTRVEDSTIVGNAALSGPNGYGGGIYRGIIARCLIASNTACVGGGTAGAVLSNCVIKGNTAFWGGGTDGSWLHDCDVVNNSAIDWGGGMYGGSAANSTIASNFCSGSGGGLYLADAHGCLITDNQASNGGGVARSAVTGCRILRNMAHKGGGASYSMLTNCLLAVNQSFDWGGVYYSEVTHCTVVSNWSDLDPAGLYVCTSRYSIVYDNVNQYGYDANHSGSTFEYSCSLPLPVGIGNVTNDPRFVDAAAGDYHLQPSSPCIDAGTNSSVDVDLDGVPRPLDGDGDGVAIADMGAYEFAGAASDTDGDGQSDSHEVVADTDPTDPASQLALLSAAPAPGSADVRIEWQGGAAARQYLECREDLMDGGPWRILYTNEPPTAVTNVIQHAGVTNDAMYYRIRAER